MEVQQEVEPLNEEQKDEVQAAEEQELKEDEETKAVTIDHST